MRARPLRVTWRVRDRRRFAAERLKVLAPESVALRLVGPIIVRRAWCELLTTAHEGETNDTDGEQLRDLASLASAVDDQVAARLSVELLQAALPRPAFDLIIYDGVG